jgi:3-dehydroquinate synthetase
LSQIDASIGGKTAINLDQAKNILGSFYQPRAVFIDPVFLSTLGQKEIKEGIAEAIKYGVIKDQKLFSFLKKNHQEITRLKPSCLLKLIYACVRIKARIVEEDEQEKKGIRTILNFGHTLAHALETSKKYRRLSHGEAVSLGMLYAARLSYALGMCEQRVLEEIYHTLRIFHLPTRLSFDYLTVYKAMSYDKKFISAKFRLVLVRSIGKVSVVEGIAPKKILQSLKIFSASN